MDVPGGRCSRVWNGSRDGAPCYKAAMFGFVSWEADAAVAPDALRDQVFATFPDKAKACRFLATSAVFVVDNVTQFWNAIEKIEALDKTLPTFRYSASVHDDRRSFTGYSKYKLTPEVLAAMGAR
jgi:hypothetical protein